jgi:hypothetical protein
MMMILLAANWRRRANALCVRRLRVWRLTDHQSRILRQELAARLAYERSNADADETTGSEHGELLRRALRSARQAVLAMRANDEIGDDAFHRMEEELDWLEMAGGRKGEWSTRFSNMGYGLLENGKSEAYPMTRQLSLQSISTL